MSQKVKTILGIVVFALLIMGAVLAYNTLSKQSKPENNTVTSDDNDKNSDADNAKQKASDFAMTNKDGNTVMLSDLLSNGKPIVLNFWASWCPPCKSEMPEFEAVYKELGDEVQFMMVDLVDGQRETAELGAMHIARHGFTFPVYFDTEQEAAYAYGIRSIPTTLFIDTEGYIVTGRVGALDEEMLREHIEMIR